MLLVASFSMLGSFVVIFLPESMPPEALKRNSSASQHDDQHEERWVCTELLAPIIGVTKIYEIHLISVRTCFPHKNLSSRLFYDICQCAFQMWMHSIIRIDKIIEKIRSHQLADIYCEITDKIHGTHKYLETSMNTMTHLENDRCNNEIRDICWKMALNISIMKSFIYVWINVDV